MRLFKILFLSSLFAFSTAQADTQNDFQTYLNQWRTQNSITGIVVSVEDLNTGKITDYTSGTTTQNGNTPVTPENLFGIGSITKTFISAALLQLQEEKKLNLDTPIGRYFPQYPSWENVTIRQLLNMTGGVPNYTEQSQFNVLSAASINSTVSPETLLNIAYQVPVYFAPGKGWHYSNTDYILLGLIIEKVTHEPVNRVLKHRFFKQLHLDNTFYSETFYPSSVEKKMAHAYVNGQDVTNFNAGLYGAAGGMVMNSHNLLTWTHALFSPGIILNKESIKQLETTVAVPDQSPRPNGSLYGLGVFATQDPKLGTIWWYAGVIQGYTSALVWIPSQNKIITAQASSWPKRNYQVLFEKGSLIQKLLSE